MKAYILSVAGAVLISAVITVILPSGKMGKFIAGALRLFVLVVMIAPLAGLVQGKPLALGNSAHIAVDGAYFERSAAALEAHDEAAIGEFLAENYDVSAKVDVERARDPLFVRKKIRIELALGGIIAEDEHIYILTSIEEAVSARWGCAVEVV